MRQDNRLIEAVIIGFLLCASLLWARQAWSAEITQEQAIRAIIGEASGEGLEGMTAVAEVIRIIGSLRGIYGVNARHIDKEPDYVWKMAYKAWQDSETSNLTHGATHFESTDFKTPYWAKEMKEVAHIGKHKFYK